MITGVRSRVVVIAATVLGLLGLVEAEQQPSLLTVESVMTAEEMKQAGILKLTESERQALNRWLNRYTRDVLKLAAGSGRSGLTRSTPGSYIAVGSGHWVQEVSSGGSIVTLEDGSMWEVNVVDRIYTMIWLPITDITVTVARDPIGDYKYVLVNKDDAETALVRFLGQE